MKKRPPASKTSSAHSWRVPNSPRETSEELHSTSDLMSMALVVAGVGVGAGVGADVGARFVMFLTISERKSSPSRVPSRRLMPSDCCVFVMM